jgi:hypothetical protein
VPPPPPRRRRKAGTTPVADALRALDPAAVACRDLAHAWEVDGYRAEGGNVHRLLVCSRCGTERRDAWSLAGRRIGSRYSYAADYRLKDVDHPGDRHALRVEVLRRAGYRPTRGKRNG